MINGRQIKMKHQSITLVQLLGCLLCVSQDDLKHNFSGSLLSAGASDLSMFDGRDCRSESTSKDIAGWSTPTPEIVGTGDISPIPELSISWIPNSLQPLLVSCFLSHGSLLMLAEKVSLWVSVMIGQHRRLLIAVDGAWLLIAVDGALLALNPMEPDCDADENIHAGLYDEYGSSPLCGPEKENIWAVSTWDFQEPT